MTGGDVFFRAGNRPYRRHDPPIFKGLTNAGKWLYVNLFPEFVGENETKCINYIG